jgi:hypothetical protein
MEQQCAVRVLVTRLGESTPVRKKVGVLVRPDASFGDLLAKALTFGQSPMSEFDVVKR